MFHTIDQTTELTPLWQWFLPTQVNQATYFGATMNTMPLNDTHDPSWYMNTGATSHLASNTCKLHSLINKNKINYVHVGKGSPIPVTHSLVIPIYT